MSEHKVGDLLWDEDNNEFGVIIKIREPQTSQPEEEFLYTVRFINTGELDGFREWGIRRYKRELKLKLEGFE
jgi:hypothetical protein